MGKITSKCKGGCIVEHIDTGSLMFLPGSQISDKPLKDISHLMNEPQKFSSRINPSTQTYIIYRICIFHIIFFLHILKFHQIHHLHE